MVKEAPVDTEVQNVDPEKSSPTMPNSSGINQNINQPVSNSSLAFYDMTKRKHLIIFNHHTFEDTRKFGGFTSTRNGTYEDVRALKKVFLQLGFEVSDYDNKRYKDIEDSLQEFCNEDHKDTSCVCVAILTHGGKDGTLYASDRPYLLQDILKLFEDGHPGLRTKPKLFFIQACRGEKTDGGKFVEVDSVGNYREIIKVPSHSDFLILRSTIEGYVSYRNSYGSWMIQALCKAVEEHHETLDIHQIITVVNQKVGIEQTTQSWDPAYDNKKQMPETCHTLTKIFKFK